MNYIIQGLMIGFAYVAPIGVQNLFVINTALTQRKQRVYLTALIVMFFDVTLSIGCFFGIGAVMSASKWLEFIVLWIGSLIVLYIGFSIFKSKAGMSTETNVDIPIMKVVTTACVVTWLNPQALIDGTMLLGAFKASIPSEYGLLFIASVCTAQALWWLGISTIFSLFKAKITDKVFRAINIVCGLVIMFYGVKLFISFIQMAMELFG